MPSVFEDNAVFISFYSKNGPRQDGGTGGPRESPARERLRSQASAAQDADNSCAKTARAVDDLQRTLLDTQQKINDAIAVSLTHGVGGVGGLSGVGCR